MPNEKKVRYLNTDRGRYCNQRRVPKAFQDLLGIRKWQKPCGDVSYTKAVQLIVTWAEEHNDLLARLKTKEGYEAIEAEYLRSEDEAFRRSLKTDSVGKAPQRIYEEDGEIKSSAPDPIQHQRRFGGLLPLQLDQTPSRIEIPS